MSDRVRFCVRVLLVLVFSMFSFQTSCASPATTLGLYPLSTVF